jgi:hypothetical protein
MHAANLILGHANIGQTIFRWKEAEVSPDTADTKGKGGLVCFVDPSSLKLGSMYFLLFYTEPFG